MKYEEIIEASIKTTIATMQKEDKLFFMDEVLLGYIENSFVASVKSVSTLNDTTGVKSQKTFEDIKTKYPFIGYSNLPLIPEYLLGFPGVFRAPKSNFKLVMDESNSTVLKEGNRLYTFDPNKITVKPKNLQPYVTPIFQPSYYEERLEVHPVINVGCVHQYSKEEVKVQYPQDNLNATSDVGKTQYGLFAKKRIPANTYFLYSGMIIRTEVAEMYSSCKLTYFYQCIKYITSLSNFNLFFFIHYKCICRSC